MKTSKSFRLSVQALQALSYLSDETGTNETAIIEIALAHYRQAYNNAKMAEIAKVTDVVLSRHMVDKLRLVDPAQGQSLAKKKRKRH
jgi:predicted DNA-binding protein